MTRVYKELLSEDLQLGSGVGVKPNPGGGELTGTKIGIQSFGVGGAAVTDTWDPGSIPVGAKISKTVTVAGAALGDFVLKSFDKDLQELQLTADVSAANTVEAVLGNLTGSAVDLESGTLKVLVLKSG